MTAKAAGGGAVKLLTNDAVQGQISTDSTNTAWLDMEYARRIEALVRTNAESALKLQADRIAELEGALRALRRSHDADSHGHGLTVAQLLTIDDALAKTA